MKRYRSVKLDCDEAAEKFIAEKRRQEIKDVEEEKPAYVEKKEEAVDSVEEELVFSTSVELDEE